MRYAQMRSMDISNGEGVGVSLFVQGCPFHCEDCFNPETWDFDGGKEWTAETEKQFLSYVSQSHIKRVSFLGGEPLAEQNIETINTLMLKIKKEYPDKQIWLYSGFTLNSILLSKQSYANDMRKSTIDLADVFVDGQYDKDKKDPRLKFRGSWNQNVWFKVFGVWNKKY